MLREYSGKKDFEYTIMRPQLIVGPNHGVVMNIPPVMESMEHKRNWVFRFLFPEGLLGFKQLM